MNRQTAERPSMLQWMAMYLATTLVLGGLILLLLPARVLPFAPTVAFAAYV